MKTVFLALFLFLFATRAGAQQDATAADSDQQLAAGRLKVDQVCANCHGLDGRAASGGNSAMSPSLTAQPRNYLVARLKDYRDGRRQHPQMTLIARMISEQDIEDVSLWYSNLEMTIAAMPGDPGAQDGNGTGSGQAAPPLKVSQVCSSCHGLDGRALGATIMPHLTGQQKAYLLSRLKDYRSGKIEHPLMSPVAQGLSDEDIQLVAEWYANIRIEVGNLD